MGEIRTTCPYCGVGCGVLIATDGTRITGARGDPDHPANFGRLCTKGRTLHLTAGASARALFPQLRSGGDSPRERVSWDQALDLAADKFAAIVNEHGPDSVAFYISGQLLTEDYYVFNKLAKGLIGTNNIDTNSRLCMSSAAAGYKATLGADAPPACYEDIDYADCLFIAGSNTAYAHPVLFRRIEDARRRNPELKIIVVDPRRTATAAAADLFLPILPGTDIALYNAMLHVMLWEGLCDMEYIRARTEGFDALKDAVREYTPQAAAALCGVPAADIIRAAKWFGADKATLSLYCQGLNQSSHGTHNNAALINLHLATRQIGKPGAGPLSLTGQPNAMGGREVGGMANLLSAHRDLANPEHRSEVARLWGVENVPEKPGKTAVELFEALRSGEVKAVWIACTNPAQSMPDQNAVRAAQTFLPMHWGSRFMRGAGANALTVSASDPVSRQPELKHAAIEVEKLDLPHRVVAMRRFVASEAGAAQALLETLRPFLERFDYATLGLTGRDAVVVVLRGYSAAPVADGVLDALDRLLDLHQAERTMRYVDARRRVEKAARIEEGVVQSVCLSGETAAQEWLKNMMVQGASADAMRAWILAPASAPPRGSFNRGATVCNCFDVSEAEIRTALAAGADLAQLQHRLKCGTDCGSCLPELECMLAAVQRGRRGAGVAESL